MLEKPDSSHVTLYAIINHVLFYSNENTLEGSEENFSFQMIRSIIKSLFSISDYKKDKLKFKGYKNSSTLNCSKRELG